MDGNLSSLLSSSSLSSSGATGTGEENSPQKDSSLPPSHRDHKSTEELWAEDVSPVGGSRLLSAEEQVTLITESMIVTSTDQEKLLLLNKNTELRRVNKELMKLNADWDHMYRNATLGLQHRLEELELENAAVKQLNSRLLLRVEHQQSAKEYYEQELMRELKKNQELYEYIRLMESGGHHPDRDHILAKQGSFASAIRGPVTGPTTNPPVGPDLSPGRVSGYNPSPSLFPASSSLETGRARKSPSRSTPLGEPGGSQREVQDLKQQLEALHCQTQIYEAEYQTEHSDHKHTLQENRRLRKKREETRQQVALLQEQLKVYEDDFRRERSDKQMLQRLLMKKTPPHKDPELIHRCNNEQQPPEGDKRTQSGDKRKQHHPLCPKHPNRDKDSD
uniref:uncharacterized protein si:ch211-153b23.7 n=1 Tax=Gasterosteus aculeatus aculeatus TaxID=481459 RepID=UPI001A99D4AA|nr:uncharacterized protein si:ch211-153b23.7 [Gasterosteus aculeatus aculeatus]